MRARILSILSAAFSIFALSSPALAQSVPPWLFQGSVPTAAQWQQGFGSKQDVLGYTPLNKAGDTMGGLLRLAPASSASTGFSVQQGMTPASPNNGDMWITTAGLYYRANGVTYGPLTGAVNCSTMPALSGAISSTAGTCTTAFSGIVPIANGGTGAASSSAGLAALGGAGLASPAFTGTPTAPTASSSTNTTQVATTAFVKNQAYAALSSPTFIGVPAAPTASPGTDTTQIATTEFVTDAIASGGIVTSVFGRTGDVVAANNDYAFSQISGTAAISQGGTGATGAAAARNNLAVPGIAVTNEFTQNQTLDNLLCFASCSVTGGQIAYNPATFAFSLFTNNGGLAHASELDVDTLVTTNAIALASGGTGATSASGARTSLGVTATGADTTYAFRANNGSDFANFTTFRSNVGLAIGTNVAPATTGTSILKANSGGFANAVANTDYLAVASPTFSGTETGPAYASTGSYSLSRTGQTRIATPYDFDTSAGQYRKYGATTSGTFRWNWGATNSTESGSNAGTDWELCRGADAGTLLDCPLSFLRQTGTATFADNVILASDELCFGATDACPTSAGNSGILLYDGTSSFSLKSKSVGVTSFADLQLGSLTLNTTPLGLSSGGTGAGGATGARTNLGVTATGADTTYAYRANNLSDIASASAALANLGAAPRASPTFTGAPTAPTASPGTNTTQIASTAFVTAAVGAGGIVSSVFGRTGPVTATSGDYSFSLISGTAAISQGGTGGTTAATARSSLSVPGLATANEFGQNQTLDNLLCFAACTGAPGGQIAFNTSTFAFSLFATNGAGAHASQLNVDTLVTTNAIAVTSGGTGGTSAAGARTSLGVAIGTNVEAWDADLDAIAALSSTGIVKRTGTATWGFAVAGTDYIGATSGSAIQKANGSGGLTAAVSATDYAPATTGSSILKASSGGFANAVAGTDYAGLASTNAYTGQATWSAFDPTSLTGEFCLAVICGSATGTNPAVGLQFTGGSGNAHADLLLYHGTVSHADLEVNNLFADTPIAVASGGSGSFTSAGAPWLLKANNLSDVTSYITAQNNLKHFFIQILTQFDKAASTGNALVPSSVITPLSGENWRFSGMLFLTADATGGIKFHMGTVGGAMTVSSIHYHVRGICNTTGATLFDQRMTDLTTSVSYASGCTSVDVEVSGSGQWNGSGGNFGPVFAQSVASGTSSVLVDSTMDYQKTN